MYVIVNKQINITLFSVSENCISRDCYMNTNLYLTV